MRRNDEASKWLALELVKVGEGRVVVTLEAGQHHCNGHGMCHGGIIFSLADSAFAFACNSRDRRTVAQHNLMSYIAPACKGDTFWPLHLTFAPTEAAGMGAAGAFLIALLRGSLNFRGVAEVLIEAAQTTAVLFAVLIGAWVFSNFVNIAGLPEALNAAVANTGLAPMAVIFLILIIYVALGCGFESLSMLLLTVPRRVDGDDFHRSNAFLVRGPVALRPSGPGSFVGPVPAKLDVKSDDLVCC